MIIKIVDLKFILEDIVNARIRTILLFSFAVQYISNLSFLEFISNNKNHFDSNCYNFIIAKMHKMLLIFNCCTARFRLFISYSYQL